MDLKADSGARRLLPGGIDPLQLVPAREFDRLVMVLGRRTWRGLGRSTGRRWPTSRPAGPAWARELVAKRDAWLNPSGADAAELKRRTLTGLYNARPAWLDLVHKKLDAAVLDAYGWRHDLSDDEILAWPLALNHARSGEVARGNR